MNRKKGWKRILPLALCIGLLFAASVPAMAEELDLDRTGSVSLRIRAYATEDVVGGGSLNLYQVAEMSLATYEGVFYYYTDAFSGCSEELLTEEGLAGMETAETFSDWVEEHGVSAVQTVSVSASGEAQFTDLSCGLYLVTQNIAADGYTSINAFLVSVPIYEDDTWIYDVDATPKTRPVTTMEEPEEEPGDEPEDEPEDRNTPGGGTMAGGNSEGTSGGSAASDSSATSSSGNARTGDYNYSVYGILVIAAAVVIVVVLRRRTRRTTQ